MPTSTLSSVRSQRNYQSWRTSFLDRGATLSDCLADGARRVLVVGGFGQYLNDVRLFAESDPGPGWGPAPSGHHLPDSTRAVARFVHDDGRRCDILSSESWFGDTCQTATDATASWARLCEVWRRSFDTDPMSAPSTSGRDAWQRLIRTPWPVLSDRAQAKVREVAAQGRIEAVPPLIETDPAPIVDLWDLDGRMMYGALATLPLPVGEPQRTGAGELPRRGWVFVRFSAPGSWPHRFGVLPVRSVDGSLSWPLDGWGWAESVEVDVAQRHGWTVDILEGVAFTEGRPLRAWAERLMGLAADAEQAGDRPLRHALRSALLHSIGAFWSADRIVVRSAPIDQADPGPAATDVHVSDDGRRIVWHETETTARPDLVHPEWAGCIWARCRARLLDGPGDTGALWLPPGEVVAFRTDSILSTTEPAWPDDGRPGRFRVKASARQVPRPATMGDVYSVLDSPGGESS